MDSDSEHSSEPSSSDDEVSVNEPNFLAQMSMIKDNDPDTTRLVGYREYQCFQTMTDAKWEELGRDIANNTHLHEIEFSVCDLDDRKISSFFRGLTRSSSITKLCLHNNQFSSAGLRSMLPFLENTNNLKYLNLDNNNIQSEGFNALFHALHNSPIEELDFGCCGIRSIEIDGDLIPQNLTSLRLEGNKINSDGCREIAKLLQGGGSTMTSLHLDDSEIDDEGVAILVDALKTNTCLKHLYTRRNDGITVEGMKSFLRLVNDISSVNATMQSNHTLRDLDVIDLSTNSNMALETIQYLINNAVGITRYFSNPNDQDSAGKQKIRLIQLDSSKRKEFADCQGVTRSLYSEIHPLHLPEVLALVSRIHEHGELYAALKSSIAGVISAVNRRECIQQQRAYHLSKLKELDAELAAMDDAARGAVGIEGGESRSSKRRRK